MTPNPEEAGWLWKALTAAVAALSSFALWMWARVWKETDSNKTHINNLYAAAEKDRATHAERHAELLEKMHEIHIDLLQKLHDK